MNSFHSRCEEILGMKISKGDNFTYDVEHYHLKGSFVRFQAAPIDEILMVFSERNRERSYFMGEISNLRFASE